MEKFLRLDLDALGNLVLGGEKVELETILQHRNYTGQIIEGILSSSGAGSRTPYCLRKTKYIHGAPVDYGEAKFDAIIGLQSPSDPYMLDLPADCRFVPKNPDF